MRTLNPRRTRLAALATALALGATAVVLLPTPAHAATADFTKESEWAAGYIGTITVRNDTSTTMTGWRVEFTLPAGTRIATHWNAELSQSGTRYSFANLSWNGNVAPGATTSFGFMAYGSGTPQNCVINGVPCDGSDTSDSDFSPPTIPANPRTSFTSQTLTLHWDASTDNVGVAGYEIFSNGSRIATTIETSYTMPVPPPMVFTFGIRALDAAGNSSPFAIIKLGEVPDSDPPTAPTNLRLEGPRNGHFRLVWNPSQDNVFVAGYEVQQFGTVTQTTLVGDTFAFGPYRSYGTYMFRVRAFDSSGNYSAPAQYGIAIDPPPPTLTPSPTRTP